MKTLVLLSALVASPLLLVGQQLAKNYSKDYNYFLRETKIADNNNTRIVITDKGDTTLVAEYKSQDVVNKTHQEFTKVYKGTPYFKNGWYNGKIGSESGKDLSFLMAYNLQKQVVYIVEKPDADATPVRPDEFTIAGHTFRKYENIFLETLYMQKNILLKSYECVLSADGFFEKTGYEAQGGEFAYQGEFRKSYKYFTIQDDLLRAVSIGKKALQTFPRAKRGALQRYVKENGINLKTEEGLVAVFRYYDTL
ncbi:hypothetical protein [Emticicia sp. 17c]|uniref:hypothetical protein n=1 Tax=Emticicia sp. 17c TaxID=3127704 RepID=UPI00301C84FB